MSATALSSPSPFFIQCAPLNYSSLEFAAKSVIQKIKFTFAKSIAADEMALLQTFVL